MSSSIRFELRGMKELQAKLKDVHVDISREVYRDVIPKAADMVVQSIRAGAPVNTGTLRDAVKSKLYSKLNTVTAMVRPGRTAHLVENGTKPHAIPRSNKKTGARWVWQHPGARAKPFFWRAVEAVEEAVLDLIEKLVGEHLERSWRR